LDVGVGRHAACQPPFPHYLEQRGADFLIAVKHSQCKGLGLLRFRDIRDLLTFGRQAPFQVSKCERKRGLDLTRTLGLMLLAASLGLERHYFTQLKSMQAAEAIQSAELKV
jgi:hypothetical protein